MNPGREQSAACTGTTATLQREVPEERKTSSVLLGGDGYGREYIMVLCIYTVYIHKQLLKSS
jgi:hypothetical protein